MTPLPRCHGACPKCHASYHENDFGTDGNGSLVVIHVCARRYVDPASLPRYGTQATVKVCLDCGCEFVGTETSLRCPECATARRKDRAREIRTANLLKANAHKCCECKRPATKASDRCRFHQRQLQIRNGLGRRVDRLVQDGENAA